MSEAQVFNLRIASEGAREIVQGDFWKIEPRWLSEGAFTLLMVHLNDVLGGLNRAGRRLTFSDDMPSGDITDLVVKMRNATCHLGSPLRRMGGVMSSYNISVRHAGYGAMVGDQQYEQGHPDDVAIFYGELRILLTRHIHRAIAEADEQIQSFADEIGMPRPAAWWPRR